MALYCLVDDGLKNILNDGKLRQRGFMPKLSDSEIMTMQITAEFLGIDTDKGAWEYFSQHWLHLFPVHVMDSSSYYQEKI